LAYFTSKELDLSQGIELIKNKNIKKIAIANPKTAPYGVATVEAFKNAKLYEEIKSKFVYGESISQTVIYATKATDIGFIAKSALFSPNMTQFKKDVHWKEVDTKLYTPIDQGIVLLKHGEKNAEASAFYAFVLGNKAGKVFEAFGYVVP